MFKESLPQFVIIGFGSMDPLLKDFNEETFTQAYLKVIKEAQALFQEIPKNLELYIQCTANQTDNFSALTHLPVWAQLRQHVDAAG